MTINTLLILLVTISIVSLWQQIHMRYWAIICAIPIVTYGYTAINNSYSAILITALLLSFVSILSIPLLRRTIISNHLFRYMKKRIPSISKTEHDALDAGTVWLERDLFNGTIDWKELLAIKSSSLSDAENDFLNGPVEELCHMLDDWEITNNKQDMPKSVWKFIRHNGFFGMIIPKRYGGLEFSALAHSTVIMKIASRSVTAAVTVMVPNSLGPAELLLRYGTHKQQEYYLPRLAAGEDIPCFALTEPEAGSDAAGISASGVVCKQVLDGEQQLGIRLNWQKRYITLGPIATLLGLAFRLYDPNHLLGDKDDLGITLALIPSNLPGITIGDRHAPLNLAFQNGPNSGHDVFISIDNIIGGQNRIGDGWRMLMDCLATGRSISLPALATGAGKLASRVSGAYCRIRRQFKRPIANFEGIKAPLARIVAYTYMLDAARKLTATAIDQGQQPAVISAIIKYQHTEHMRKIINDAMDIHGGKGICLGPKNLLGRVYQAIPVGITVEGANILTRSLIIYGQGALRCHRWLYPLLTAANDNNLRDFDHAIMGLIGDLLGKIMRPPVYAIGLMHLFPVTGRNLVDKQLREISRLSTSFALISDCTILLLGASLKRREHISGRLADALGMLYLATATIKQFHDDGYPEDMKNIVDWVMQYCTDNVEQALFGVLQNYPNKTIASLLRVLCFPTGRHSHPPMDKLSNHIADLITSPGKLRDKLTAGIYIPSNNDDALAVIEEALINSVEIEHIEHRIFKAVKENQLPSLDYDLLIIKAVNRGIISELEFKSLQNFKQLHHKVIAVDDFPNKLITRSIDHGITHKARKASIHS